MNDTNDRMDIVNTKISEEETSKWRGSLVYGYCQATNRVYRKSFVASTKLELLETMTKFKETVSLVVDY